MLIVSDYLEEIVRQSRFRPNSGDKHNYFTTDIMEFLNVVDADEISLSISRASQACQSLHISFDRNFKRVFRFDGECMVTDWKITALACYLIIINCNPQNEQVARAQLYFAMSGRSR